MNLIEDAYQKAVSSWRARDISTREELAGVLDDYRVRFAYHSGVIENPAITYHDTRDVFEDGRVAGYTGELRTLFEIQNLKDCHELVLNAWNEQRDLDERLVLEFHRVLTKGTYDQRRWEAGERPGSYKCGDYVVGAGDVGAAPDEVHSEIVALLDEANAADVSKPLVIAAYFHATFESIHPFADGNGRCGRELTNYLLMRLDHPPVIVFEDDRLAYYGAMEAWDAERDLAPMLDFLKAETVRTWLKV